MKSAKDALVLLKESELVWRFLIIILIINNSNPVNVLFLVFKC